LPRLLEARGLSIRRLADSMDIDPTHLSRVVRSAGKVPSRELARRAALALELPYDYFPEYREAVVVERIRRNPAFRDDLYDELTHR
jgi:transcriptional regulator with XRE-family HTH domain